MLEEYTDKNILDELISFEKEFSDRKSNFELEKRRISKLFNDKISKWLVGKWIQYEAYDKSTKINSRGYYLIDSVYSSNITISTEVRIKVATIISIVGNFENPSVMKFERCSGYRPTVIIEDYKNLVFITNDDILGMLTEYLYIDEGTTK